ncbi:MAG: galactose ABC transporter substrate-binding protein [Lawsonibacter sp.]|nr:galactose ABC transporter substrate-binding protein [Lawsonibacter sp.]
MIRTIKNCFSRLHPDRLISLVLTAALLLPLLTGCRSGAETEGKTMRMGVALYAQDDTFISTVVQDLERMAQEEEEKENLKINLSTADGRSNQTTQMGQVDRFLTRDCDVLCVNIVDRTAAAVIIDKAEEAGVPLIFFNRQPVAEDIQRWNRIYYVGARAEEGGTLQGQLVLDAWRDRQDELDRNGDGVLQYVMLEGEPGHQDALLRTEYSIKALTDAGVEVEKLVSDTANWNRGQATAKMKQWLEEFGPEIEVVFANNDDMALGAIDAVHEAGAELPLVVGVDATAPALEAVKSGELYGTVLNDAQGIAQAMLDLALTLTKGEDPADTMELEDDHYIWLPYQPVTQANLSEFLEGYSS